MSHDCMSREFLVALKKLNFSFDFERWTEYLSRFNSYLNSFSIADFFLKYFFYNSMAHFWFLPITYGTGIFGEMETNFVCLNTDGPHFIDI